MVLPLLVLKSKLAYFPTFYLTSIFSYAGLYNTTTTTTIPIYI